MVKALLLCLLLMSISIGCKQKAPGGVATDGALVIQTVELRAEFKKDSKVVGVCKRGTVAKYLEKDHIEKELWYHIDCDGLNGWFKFTPDLVVVGPLAGLADGKDKILEKYPPDQPPSAPIAFNTLTLAAMAPADDVIPHKKWKPYATTVAMRHAVLGLWPGSKTWVLMFTDGSGADSCAELSRPTGHLIVTVMLPGPPGKEASTEPIEPTDATILVQGFNAMVPLSDMTSKSITFAASEGTKGTLVRGTIDISGEYFSVKYQIAGSFEAVRCL